MHSVGKGALRHKSEDGKALAAGTARTDGGTSPYLHEPSGLTRIVGFRQQVPISITIPVRTNLPR